MNIGWNIHSYHISCMHIYIYICVCVCAYHYIKIDKKHLYYSTIYIYKHINKHGDVTIPYYANIIENTINLHGSPSPHPSPSFAAWPQCAARWNHRPGDW